MTWNKIYQFLPVPFTRRHGPSGYDDYRSMKPWLRDEFAFRCVYCLDRETFNPSGGNTFASEHVLPKASNSAIKCDYQNLVYACSRCNTLKGEELVVNPLEVDLRENVVCNENGEYVSDSTEGRVFIADLGLNEPSRVAYRRVIIKACIAAVKYPEIEELQIAVDDLLRLPEDPPDLRSLRPAENHFPNGIEQSFFEWSKKNKLPDRLWSVGELLEQMRSFS